MPKKTTILVIVLAIVTLILLFLAVVQSQNQNKLATNVVPTKKPVEKTAKVYFSPQSLNATTSASADIFVDTGNGDITGVQTELEYDPKALTNVRLIPSVDASGFFGAAAVILFNETNQASGRISYAITINAGQPTRKGVGKIATLTFQRLPGGPSSTLIKFLDKTLVTQLGAEESVLKQAVPLTIVFNQTRVPTVVSTIPPSTSVPNQ